jgi:hypothetical protein
MIQFYNTTNLKVRIHAQALKNPFPVPLGTPTIPVEIMCLI